MTEREKIEVEVLEELLKDIQGVSPEYIVESIEEQISILKYGL